jgi:hypothetical protein
MRSLLKLSASQEKIAVAISAFDEAGTMWIGILGTLPISGFYALVLLFDVNVPSFVSDNLGKIETLLAEIGLKLPQNEVAFTSFAKQVFTETQELLDRLGRESTSQEQCWSEELKEGIEKVAEQVRLLVNEYQRTGVHPDRHLTRNAMTVISSLTLLAVKCDRHRVAQTLTSLLTQLERI